jgi:hypothetical protein
MVKMFRAISTGKNQNYGDYMETIYVADARIGGLIKEGYVFWIVQYVGDPKKIDKSKGLKEWNKIVKILKEAHE